MQRDQMMRRRTGFMFPDALMALILLSSLAAMFFVAVHQEDVGLQKLSNSREAARLAESAITSMQSGQAIPDSVTSPDIHLKVQPLSDPAPTPDQVWVDVTASVRNASTDVVGLVPRKSAPAGGLP
jgi:type II secretory pathway pseudopilin PulG